MDSSMSTSFLLQFAYRIPILFVYLVGFILAIAFWKRCPRAYLLTLVATGLELLTTPLFTFLQIYIVQKSTAPGWSMMHWMATLGIVGSFLHTVSIALLLIAVFIGRPRPAMISQSLESIQNS